jgi:hypothetical protein
MDFYFLTYLETVMVKMSFIKLYDTAFLISISLFRSNFSVSDFGPASYILGLMMNYNKGSGLAAKVCNWHLKLQQHRPYPPSNKPRIELTTTINHGESLKLVIIYMCVLHPVVYVNYCAFLIHHNTLTYK